MGDWAPMARGVSGSTGQRPGLVRLTTSGLLMISADIATRFRPHQRVEPLRNGNAALLGLRGTAARPATRTPSIGGGSRVAASVFLGGTLTAIGKEPPKKSAILPHHWDGDVLVIDLSGLPDATGGQ
mgnify:FL=1